MNSFKEALRKIYLSYLNDNVDHSELNAATQSYKKLLFDWYSNHFSNELDPENLASEYGTAISSLGAASCIEDGYRTRQFIRGISKALDQKLTYKGPIHVVYAGTGPFANLLLPIFQEYAQFDIHYTLVEINPPSFTILKRLMEEFNQSEFEIKLKLADASKLKIPFDERPDIIISETMQAGLRAEPQVAILQNLIPQAKNNAFIIPQNIKLSLGLIAQPKASNLTQQEVVYREYPVFETINFSSTVDSFSSVHTQIQEKDLLINSCLALLTEIRVFEDELIQMNQSGLTVPLKLMDLPDEQATNYSIISRYQLKPKPELIIKMM
ncbi:hypothetical protein JYB62_09705 [Algoriphagus lutimaris]|uniref:hypothetical protein n=1 Tax=Algoriphagus lutimaris TaxID=613197 RepID=UPI00196ADDC2|nr:hypothetical protein [Algoriphagus lutimaris]MBN3520277.1 hypothetical protein [Algoriphagus lutimaris]